jgi:hypothetical protein
MCRCSCVKVRVTMPDELVGTVRAFAGHARFSEYVTDAAENRLRQDLLDELHAELEAEYGPVPPEVRAQTRRMWPGNEAE